MQFFLVTAALLSTGLAAPSSLLTKRDCIIPSDSVLIGAINQWQIDISSVNGFLNSPPPAGTSDLLSDAQNAFNKASDEPTQLNLLNFPCVNGCNCVPEFADAVTALMNVFKPQVLDNLQKIISSFDDADTVNQAVNDINQVRCCVVLPSAQTLFEGTVASNNLVGIVTDVPRENACASISC